MLKKLSYLLLFTLIFACSSTNSISKSKTSELDTQFVSYLTALSTQNFEQAIKYIPEELYDYIPKTMMMKALKESYGDPTVTLYHNDIKVFKGENIAESKNIIYTKFDYESIISMHFSPPDNETVSKKKERISYQISFLREEFGNDFRGYNEETNSIDIYEKKEVFALKKEKSNQWKFLVLDSENLNLIKELFPVVDLLD